ncbi:MAG: hypothetical protein IKJ24_02910 [Clostridia bacterium]|nr:hypothetical protein [Clostridia bacterium]
MSEQLLGNERVIRKLVREGDPLVDRAYGITRRKNNGLLFKRNFADGTLISFNIVSHKKRSISMVTLYMNNADYQKKKSPQNPAAVK